MKINRTLMADLITFARVEVETKDVEPWADLLKELNRTDALDREELLWVLYGYNTYDSFSSGWSLLKRWPKGPDEWYWSDDRLVARDFPIMQERRNLFGGRVINRHESYAAHVQDGTQEDWLSQPIVGVDPGKEFTALTTHLRTVTQVGRQAAFEWAEFLGKCVDFPVDAADGQLWESSGPRESLERLYNLENPSPSELEDVAWDCRERLEDDGVPLAWVDFETIICDFKVMTKGRYFPGRHLTALKEEINEVDDVDDQMMLLDAFHSVVPENWSSIPAGLASDRELKSHYVKTGEVITNPWWW